MTEIPQTDTPLRMGRPPLSSKGKSKQTAIRLSEDIKSRIEALAGPNRMSQFIREAIEKELRVRERNAKNCKPDDQ